MNVNEVRTKVSELRAKAMSLQGTLSRTLSSQNPCIGKTCNLLEAINRLDMQFDVGRGGHFREGDEPAMVRQLTHAAMRLATELVDGIAPVLSSGSEAVCSAVEVRNGLCAVHDSVGTWRTAEAPSTPGTDENVRLASGVKRYVYLDDSHPKKKWCVVEADEAGSTQRTKRRFYEVEVLGTCSFVTRPGAGLLSLGGARVAQFGVTTAALKCWRKPAEERSRVQPYAPVTR